MDPCKLDVRVMGEINMRSDGRFKKIVFALIVLAGSAFAAETERFAFA